MRCFKTPVRKTENKSLRNIMRCDERGRKGEEEKGARVRREPWQEKGEGESNPGPRKLGVVPAAPRCLATGAAMTSAAA